MLFLYRLFTFTKYEDQKWIIEEPIDLKGMAERRNVTHNYKLSGSVCMCV